MIYTKSWYILSLHIIGTFMTQSRLWTTPENCPLFILFPVSLCQKLKKKKSNASEISSFVIQYYYMLYTCYSILRRLYIEYIWTCIAYWITLYTEIGYMLWSLYHFLKNKRASSLYKKFCVKVIIHPCGVDTQQNSYSISHLLYRHSHYTVTEQWLCSDSWKLSPLCRHQQSLHSHCPVTVPIRWQME